MSKRSVHLLIKDIQEAIEKIVRYTEGMKKENFLSDDKTVDAVVRNLEIIGEAVRRLPDEFTSSHENIPWYQIAGMRNRIVHEYFGLDLEIVWQILARDLKELKNKMDKI